MHLAINQQVMINRIDQWCTIYGLLLV